jgi:hypothetical protein
MVAAMKKRYDAAHARVLTATTLLEEEQHVVVVLAKEARAMATLIEPPSPTPLGPRRSRCFVGRRLRGRRHRQHPRPGHQRAEHPFSHLGHAGPLVHALRPVARQRHLHTRDALSVISEGAQ